MKSMEALTGIGLSASAGLNAYIPVADPRPTSTASPNLITLPRGWEWFVQRLDAGAAQRAASRSRVVADKGARARQRGTMSCRPASGRLPADWRSAASSQVVDGDGQRPPARFFHGHQWLAVVSGAVHRTDPAHDEGRRRAPVINVATFGVGAPVVSTIEDGASIGMSLIAIVLPILVIVALAIVVLSGCGGLRVRLKPADVKARSGGRTGVGPGRNRRPVGGERCVTFAAGRLRAARFSRGPFASRTTVTSSSTISVEREVLRCEKRRATPALRSVSASSGRG